MAYQPIPIPMTDNVTQVGGVGVAAFPAGFMRTTDEPRTIFYDPFDAALDTTVRWNAGVSAGGGVAAAVVSGSLTMGSGTTINGYSYITSQPIFTPVTPAWLGASWAAQFESGATYGNNAVRFWGCGTVGGTPSSASPLGATGNGYGFEVDISGVMWAVVYANGVRTAIASLAASQPSDGLQHRYICYYRTDKIYWYIDGLGSANLVATSNFQNPTVQAQPVLALAVAHTSAPAASRVFSTSGMAVWDTGKNSSQLSDGTYPWRKATIKPASTPAVAADTALAVTMHPSTASLPTTNANEAAATFRGRATAFRAVGRAGTTPRRLLTLWNNTGSGKTVHINQVFCDLLQTAVMAVTQVPPIIRIYKITAAPSGGTALTKVAKDGNLPITNSNANITLLGDASADGTNSVSALTATTTAGAALTQEFAPRLITAAGYEIFDRAELLVGFDVVCRPGEGICLSLDLTAATQDPATSNWVAGIDWYEI